MKLQRVISVGHVSDGVRGGRATRHMSSAERLSLLEDIRREAARVFHYEYPRRLRRVLEVVDREKR
jgi:hypothetical protein